MDKENIIMLVSTSELLGVERIREALFNAGFKVAAVDTAQMKEAIAHQKPVLVVVNLTGCEADDLELCQRIKRLTPSPIVAVGSTADDAFRIGMIEVLLDDFVGRPVSTRELVARVRSILRRTQPAFTPVPHPSPLETRPANGQGLVHRFFHQVTGRISL